jgi:hypothetical protein
MVKINSAEFGYLTVDNNTYSSDVFVYWDGKTETAEAGVRHLLTLKQAKKILDRNPKILLVGSGHDGYFEVSDEVMHTCQTKKIQLIVMPTPAAIEKFNGLIEKRKKVIAFIHVTC